jgi:hypothetical protein
MSDSIRSQNARVAYLLRKYRKIRNWDMTYRLGISRGPARICDLKRLYKWKIRTLPRKRGQMCTYVLKKIGNAIV